jgi:hypothetical protein
VEDYVRRGMSEAQARRQARIEFGSMEAAKDAHRDSRGLAWLEGICYDLRFALRALSRDRAFTITAVSVLALAIGLNVTVFSVMSTMLFRGYPLVKRNDRLVYIQERYPSGLCCISYPDFEEWRTHAQSFEGMAFVGERFITLRDGGGERPIQTLAFTISTNAFALLGVQPVSGRDFTPADEESGAPPVTILNYRFWELHFAKRSDIVGQMVRINNTSATVIGVMPEGFDFPTKENLWMPLAHTAELQQRSPTQFMAFGRLAEGATVAGARTEVETINRRLAAAYPATNRDVVPMVGSYSPGGENAATVYGSLWAAAWFVLLIACANLANLTLARTLGTLARTLDSDCTGRGVLADRPADFCREPSACRRGRRVGLVDRHMECTHVGRGNRVAISGARLHRGLRHARLSDRDFAVLRIVVLPGAHRRVLQLDVNGSLKGDARGATQGRHGKYLSAALVATQMALAIVLLSGAGILVRSLLNVVNAEVGVREPEQVLIGAVTILRDKYPSIESRIAFFDNLKQRLLAIPGVESASIASIVPVDNPVAGPTPFELESQPQESLGRPVVSIVASGPDYFRTVGATTLAGRDFSDADALVAQPVAIINQSFAAKYWPGQNAIGKRLRLFPRNRTDEWRTVVGVVSNIMQNNPTRQAFLPLVYVPFGSKHPLRPLS